MYELISNELTKDWLMEFHLAYLLMIVIVLLLVLSILHVVLLVYSVFILID